MKSKVFFVVGLVTVFFISTPAPGQQEEITLSTYYPAPFGEYDELCAEKLLVDTPAAAELQDMARGDCHITNSLIVGAAGGGFSYDEIGGSLIDGTVLIKGDVGIGTTSPGFFKLKVNGPLRVDNAGESLFSYNTGGDVYLAIGPSYTDDSSNYMYLNAYDAGGASQGFRNIVLNQFGGNVGIGTTAPYRKLEVYGAGDTRIRASSNNAGNEWVGFELGGPGNSFEGGLFHKQNDNNRVSIWSQDTEAVSILNNGNVGIGTTSPGAKLHIGGTPGTDGIMFPDGTKQTSSSGKIRCRVFHNATQSITNNFTQLIWFNSESWDTDNMHGPTNNFSLFCNTRGLYLISASVRWAPRTGGKRGCWIVKAGIGVDDRLAGNEADSVAGDCYNNVTTIALLNVGDEIRVHVYQNSGSALNLDTSLAHWPYYTSYPSLTMVRIGD